jgi:porphyrinogen peroxidase
MNTVQPGVLVPVPPHARYVTYALRPGIAPRQTVIALAAFADGEQCVVGFGESLLSELGAGIDGLRPFPKFTGDAFKVSATPAALWCWLRGHDRGELVHRTRALQKVLAPAFSPESAIDAFRHGSGRDLTGYEDGTENPRGRKAVVAAAVSGEGAGRDGATFAAVQQWVHDFDRFDALSAKAQDNAIGRRKRDNVELARAPASAHVKRTAQENFTPEAFVVRRSMPWSDATRAGLMFVAFGRSLDAFEAQLKRMVGADDGITDALFKFTQPVSGAYFWCPPLRKSRLDLRAVLKK